MKQQDLERLISEAARDYNTPPDPPREAMWAAIRQGLPEAAKHAGAADSLDLRTQRARRARRDQLRRWGPWALGFAAAAVLALGFGLGRATRDRVPPAAPVAEATTERKQPSLPARLAAADHMGEAEALLTLYRSSDRTDDRLATARWARELLSTTRILLDSRVAEDPEIASLLADLEMVLVQISTSAASDSTDQELIEDGIQQRHLLAKLRAVAETPSEMAM